MIRPDEVRRKAERWWLDVLRSRLNGTIDSFFPKDIPQIGLDKAADKLARLVAIQEEQEALHQQSKAVRGSGYSLIWTTQGSRLVGQNAYITRIYLESLDESLRIHVTLSYISVWLSEFRALRLDGSRVFIIENLTTFLTFPNQPDSIAIWGGGFAVTLLGGTDWLRDKQLYYWGDLDAHGFLILNQFREHFLQTQSLLMDRATFDAHKHLISKGETTPVTELPYLTDEERSVFQLLNQNGWRVEQERLEEEWVGERLNSL